MTPESKLKARVTKFCKARGLHVMRLSFSRGVTSGWPDVQVLLGGGRSLFVELKRPGCQPTDLQNHRLMTLKDLGYDVLATSDFHEASAAITQGMAAAALYAQGRKMAAVKARGRPSTPPRRP